MTTTSIATAPTIKAKSGSRPLAAAFAASLTLLGVSLATTGQAEAAWRARYGWGVAAGVAGGLALGALAAQAAQRPVYVEEPVYPAYDECYTVRKRVWTSYGWRTVRRTVCE